MQPLHSTFVHVYFSEVLQNFSIDNLYPLERYNEILACTNEKVITQKYSAWKLLEKAVKQTFNKDLSAVKFYKQDNGKWLSEDFYFSISHTDNAVCVAVSDGPVGVDLEPIITNQKIVKKILTEKELNEYGLLEEKDKALYLTTLWTKKESIFKCLGKGVFSPQTIETKDFVALSKTVTIQEKDFIFSIFTKNRISNEGISYYF